MSAHVLLNLLNKLGEKRLNARLAEHFNFFHEFNKFNNILRKTIEGYLDSVPSLTSNIIKTLLIIHAFHSSRHLQSKWMLYFSHVSMV